jgi:uncharacterized membrane protein YfcA
VRGLAPLVLLAIFLGGALFTLRLLRKRSTDWADLIAVLLATAASGVLGSNGFSSHWPDDMIMGFFAAGFGHLAARSAWSSRGQLVRRGARTESAFFGTLLLLLLTVTPWKRWNWWWEHH